MSGNLAEQRRSQSNKPEVQLGVVTDQEPEKAPDAPPEESSQPWNRLWPVILVGVLVAGGGLWFAWHAGLFGVAAGKSVAGQDAPAGGGKAAPGVCRQRIGPQAEEKARAAARSRPCPSRSCRAATCSA